MAITNGYCTLEEFKRYALPNYSPNAADDSVIEQIIEGASRYIDAQTGRTFYLRSETRYYTVPSDRELVLDDDLYAVTTLTNGDGTVLTTSDYYLWPRNTFPKLSVFMKESSSYVWTSNSTGDFEFAITIVGSWGYSSTAPHDIRQACLDIARSAYHRRLGENTQTVATVTPYGMTISPRDISETAAATMRRYLRRF